MATLIYNRWKVILGMSSDHAGINGELGRLRTELYRVLAQVEDPRHVKHYLMALRRASREWRQIMAAADIER